MKIAVVIEYFPGEIAGGSLRGFNIAKKYQEKNHLSVVFGKSCLGNYRKMVPKAMEQKSLVCRIPCKRGPQGGCGLIRRLLLGFFRKIKKILCSISFSCMDKESDIFHLFGMVSFDKIFLVILGSLRNKKVVLEVTLNGRDDPETLVQHRTLGWLYKIALSKVDLFVCRTKQTARSVARFDPTADILFQRNPVATVREVRDESKGKGETPDQLAIVFVGVLIPRKGVMDIVSIAEELSKRGVEFDVEIIGPNPKSESGSAYFYTIQAEAERRGVGHLLKFVGAVDVPGPFFSEADIFLFPSWQEGLPNAVLEAMAHGVVPVVRYLDGVYDDIISHETNGLVVEGDFIGNAVDWIEFLYYHPEMRRALGAAAAHFATNECGFEMVTQKYLDRFGELLD